MKTSELIIKWIKRLTTFSLGLLLIGGAIFLAFLLIILKPSVQKAPSEKKVTLVETIQANQSDHQVILTAFGTIQGIRELTLYPEVSGKIIKRAKEMTEGGIVKASETLVQIDPRDYETLVQQEKAAVSKAEFELKREQGRVIIAEREWELLDPTIQSSELGRELALRKPHLIEKKAALAAAKSRLAKALLDLERTKITSPFDAVVVEKMVELGQLITPQTALGKLVATDQFEVLVSIPYEKLSWLPLDSNEALRKTHVIITQELGRGEKVEREGHILRLLGAVDPSGRMARILVTVDDPLGLSDSKLRKAPFLIGTYVKVDIFGPKLQKIYSLPRRALREENRLWVKTAQDQLQFRKIDILFKTEESVIFQDGFEKGDEVIVSTLPLAIPGMKLKSELEDE